MPVLVGGREPLETFELRHSKIVTYFIMRVRGRTYQEKGWM